MDYLVHVAINIALYAILGVSFNLLLGYTGLFAVSHAAFFGIGAYASALLALHAGWGFLWGMALGIVVAGLVGAVIALPALRVSGDYLVIVSFGLQIIVFSVMLNWQDVTRGVAGLPGIPRPTLLGWKLTTPSQYLLLFLVVAGLCVWLARRLTRSPFGRVLKAIREDEVATQALGKNITRFKVLVFVVAGALAAVAGNLYAHYVTFINPFSFTLEESIFIMAVVIVGGAGNLWGSLLGAAVLVIMPESLRFLQVPPTVSGAIRQIIYGLLLVLFMRFRPQGLWGEHAARPAAPGRRSLEATPGESWRAAELAPVSTPAAVPASGQPLLEVRGLTKAFGGIRALSNLSLTLPQGTITGLIGPNGAGKTTAFNVITGFLPPDAGAVRYRGEEITGLTPYRVARLGIARSFQDLRLFQRMTVLDNVLVARPGQSGERLARALVRGRRARMEEARNLNAALAYLDFVQLLSRAHEIAENLSYPEQKLLALARLLATEAELLLLDEPTAGLAPTTVGDMLALIRKLPERGKTVCIIEHNLDVIKGLSERVVFLDGGEAIATGAPETIMADPQLADIYFGR
ncbi:MAG: branched-chain amino acid ABC transporter ATP-binding protein/permease [Candidatus Rokubacteria bacterium]|nr:branched-chain amino acid ABC transporter ATP-binding protein/permease [Candidatus Rokubacteria bacterium]